MKIGLIDIGVKKFMIILPMSIFLNNCIIFCSVPTFDEYLKK